MKIRIMSYLNFNRLLFIVIILIVFVCIGCGGENEGDSNYEVNEGCTTTYTSYGEWLEYPGEWESILDAAGEKHSDWAFLSVTIENDGTFFGTYQSYYYDYTYYMPTQAGDIPIPVYNPGGPSKAICGGINFDDLNGIVTFVGEEEINFELIIHSSNELALDFPDGFIYSVANIQR